MTGNARKWISEVLGTYVLVLAGSFAILSAGGSDAKVVIVAFGFGFALLAGLYAFGEVSGGHFNPAVSLAALIDKRVDVTNFIGYVIAQVGGAILASITVLAATSQETVALTTTVAGEGVEVWELFALEAIFTAIFVAVILKASSSDSSGVTAFLGISLTLVVVHLSLVPFTGGSVNPARTLGPALIGNHGPDMWVYLTAPFLGAVVGWVLFKAVTMNSE